MFLILLLAFPGLSHAQQTLPPLDPALAKAQAEQIHVMQRAASATVAVFGKDGNGGGSGVVITPDGYALTNYHVTDPCGNWMRCGMADGRLYDAVIVGIDPTGDVALIKLVGREDFPTAPLGDSDKLRVGQRCFAAGNPFLLATDFQPTLTSGIISGVKRYQYPANTLLEYSDCIQTDAAINPGNSGGPLFDEEGNVIGINGRISIEKRGRVNVGVGYAISINQIKKFMGYLRSGRIVDHATLGFTVTDDDDSVIVSNILESSDAFRRGIRYEDEIVELAGRPITSANTLKNVIGTFPRGWRIPITYRREGETFDAYVRLAGLHSFEGLLALLEGPQQLQMPEKPEDPDRDNDKDDEEPDSEPHPPIAEKRQAVELPEAIERIFEERRGFANYYFNRKSIKRIHQGLRKQFRELALDNSETWAGFGQLRRGGRFELLVGSSKAKADLPSGLWSLDSSAELDTQLEPDGTGGMLLALYLLREYVLGDPQTFGDVIYLGTAPIPLHDREVDVTIATQQAVELRIYTDTENGKLLAVEAFTDSRNDPCEIYFDHAEPIEFVVPKAPGPPTDDKVVEPEAQPEINTPIRSMTVRFGETEFGEFHFILFKSYEAAIE